MKGSTVARLTEQEIEALRSIDTPTICNLLETAAPDRRGYGFTYQHLHCVFPAMRPIVGYAKTVTMRSRVPGNRTAEQSMVFRDRYLDYVSEGAEPKITIAQDLDEQPGYGALWGEVFTNVHKAMGVHGVVTNGSVRDIDAIAEDFQILAGVIAPSRMHVHMCDFACEVNVHGMTVNDGDLIHADKHGAVIIPHHAVQDLPKALDLMNRKEKAVLDVARSPDCTTEMLKAAFRVAASITS